MSDHGHFSEHGQESHALPNQAETTSPERTVNQSAPNKGDDGRYLELQSAPRFPIKLPASVRSGSTDYVAETQNISANGVLLQMDSDMPIGSAVDFTISLPADIVGTDAHVQLDCRGRVVRSFDDGGRHGIGVVIDEYRFDRS